jgi:hypothetical protein
MPASALGDRIPFQANHVLVMSLPRIAAGATSPDQQAPKHPLFDLALFASTDPQGMLMTAINIPGMFGEMLVDLPTTWPDSWHPAALSLDSWRAIIMPFYCLPFWWFVGLGLDTAVCRRGPRWGWLTLGTALFVLMAVLAAGLRFGLPEADRAGATKFVISLCLWMSGFSTFPIAWMLQRRRAKAAKSFALGAEENSALS